MDWSTIRDLMGFAQEQLRRDYYAARRRVRRAGHTPLALLSHGAGRYGLEYRSTNGDIGEIRLR